MITKPKISTLLSFTKNSKLLIIISLKLSCCNNGFHSKTVAVKKMMHRLELLEKLEDDDRDALLKVVDNYLTTAQLQTTHKKLNKV